MAHHSLGLLSGAQFQMASRGSHIKSPTRVKTRWSDRPRRLLGAAGFLLGIFLLSTVVVYHGPSVIDADEQDEEFQYERVGAISEVKHAEGRAVEGSGVVMEKLESGLVFGDKTAGKEGERIAAAGLHWSGGEKNAEKAEESVPANVKLLPAHTTELKAESRNSSSLKRELSAVKERGSETVSKQPRPSSRKRQDAFAPCSVLKVYMYDLPSKFNWGLLSKARDLDVNMSEPFNVNGPPFPGYQGGLSFQHSPEYWLTIDLLTDPTIKEQGASVAVRVSDPSQADVFFVPYWASLAYNMFIPTRGEFTQELQLQQELVDWLEGQDYWKRSGGRDHLLVLHHPNAMATLRSRLASAMWVLADFARYPKEEANLEKDVIAPYAHMVPHFEDDFDEERAWSSRTTLLFFQGSLFRKRDGIVRELLLNVLKNEPDVIVREGHTDEEGVREAAAGMRAAKFCLHPAGDTPSSNRLFDAIFSHCIPVIVSDSIELPFEDALDYREFAIFVASRNAVTPGVLVEFLRSIPRGMWARMWARLHEVAPFFQYDNPASLSGAVNRLWNEVALRLPARRLEIHRALRRVHQTDTEGLRALERRLQRMDPSFVKIERKRETPPAHRKATRRQ